MSVDFSGDDEVVFEVRQWSGSKVQLELCYSVYVCLDDGLPSQPRLRHAHEIYRTDKISKFKFFRILLASSDKLHPDNSSK